MLNYMQYITVDIVSLVSTIFSGVHNNDLSSFIPPLLIFSHAYITQSPKQPTLAYFSLINKVNLG